MTRTPISRPAKPMMPMGSRQTMTSIPLKRPAKPDPSSKNFASDMLNFIDAKASQPKQFQGPPPKMMKLNNRQPLGTIQQNTQNQSSQPQQTFKPNQPFVQTKPTNLVKPVTKAYSKPYVQKVQKQQPKPFYSKIDAPENFNQSMVINNECLIFCQSMRLGSYSVVPESNLVKICGGKILFSVPSVEDASSMVSVGFSISDLDSIKTFFEESTHYSSRSTNLLFLYPSQATCQAVRSLMGFHNQESFYLDSASQQKSQTGIIINFRGAVTEEVKEYLTENLKNAKDIKSEDANSIVISSLPKDQEILSRKFSPQRMMKRN
eukprot:GFUD01044729.1.p1 GENE.GFUD01044729.1~~GFUD01044729.1.p1  ORF type:complete len:320 (+),score=82.66 GFUD01044729.1:92-1051(+)